MARAANQMTREEFAKALKAAEEPKRTRYGNKKTTVDGITFDSMHEADCWSRLKLIERTGAIRNLQRQVAFPFVLNEVKICTYTADFVFDRLTGDQWAQVVQDAKGNRYDKGGRAGTRTDVYVIKKKMMAAFYGIAVEEV